MKPPRLLAAFGAACLCACSDSPSEPYHIVFASPIAAMRIEPETLTVVPGDTGRLSAQVTIGGGDLTGNWYINRPTEGGFYVDSLDIPGVTLVGVRTLFDSVEVFEFDTVLQVAGESEVHRAARMTDTVFFLVATGTPPDSADLALHGQYVPVAPGYGTEDFGANFRLAISP